MNLAELAKNFSTEERAIKFLENKLWPDGPVCPHCGVIGEAFEMHSKPESKNKMRPGLWKCSGCRKTFRATVGTIFEDSHIPLHKWMMAIHLMCASKKGMSAHQLHRMLGIGYRAAWFMAHRIRYAMAEEPETMHGTIEVDETYVGGKFRAGSHIDEHGRRAKDHPDHFSNKCAVVSLLERGGHVYSSHVEKVTVKNLKPMIQQITAENARIMTDSSNVLASTATKREHYAVNHAKGEYVRYENDLCVTTNAVEGFFSILKRGINGVYHHVGKQHLHRYLSEFDFRYNARDVSDGERTEQAVKNVVGKRLTYRESRAVRS